MREIHWHKMIEKAQVLSIFWLWLLDRPAPTPLHVPVCSVEAQPSGGNSVRVYLKTESIQGPRVVDGTSTEL